jgi:hypothetical protein
MMSDPDGADAALRMLRRELYWARGSVQPIRADGISNRDRLYAFAIQRRTDETQRFPIDDVTLEAVWPIRRIVKIAVWRMTRFATRRYDRLLGELAELDAGVAERLLAAEDEIGRLRAELDELRRERP